MDIDVSMVGPAFSGHVSGTAPSPYVSPGNPALPPYDTIAVPPHVSTSAWQESFYDPTSQAPASGFVKLPSGPASLATGQLTGDGFHAGTHHWHQV